MALDSYAGLQTAIATYAMRNDDEDFEAMCPTFIELCESRMNKVLRLRQMETEDTITMSNGVGDLPPDYLQFREVIANLNIPYALDVADPNAALTDFDNVTGGQCPVRFSISGNEIRVYPKSDTSLTIRYFAKIPPLATNDTNWLLSRYPELYLYGSLMEAAPFMIDDPRIGTWGQMFEAALSGARQEEEFAKYARATSRVRGATP